MSNRYSIVKLKSSKFGDKVVYGFKDTWESDTDGGKGFFSLDDDILLIESPADAITICMLLNKRLA
jgi:hypothetical protein